MRTRAAQPTVICPTLRSPLTYVDGTGVGTPARFGVRERASTLALVSAGVHVDVFYSTIRPVGDRRALFDAVERRRLEGISRESERDLYATAHLLMRAGLELVTEISAEEQRFDRLCRSCLEQHGPSRLAPPGSPDAALLGRSRWPTPHISLSYSQQMAVVAVCADREVGIDIEHWSTTDFTGFSAISLTPDEAGELQDFAAPDVPWAKASWYARKEALFKAAGYWLVVDATSARVSPPDAPPRLIEWHDELPSPEVRLADIAVPGPYACAVAVMGPHVPSYRLIDATGDVVALAARAD